MGITVATIRTTCNVGGGNQDITTADLGGLTPKAALLIGVRAIADGTPAAGLVLSYGAATAGDGEEWVVAVSSENAQETTNTFRRATDDECVMFLNPADGSIDGEANFNSFIADGVRITWGNNPAAAYYLTVVLWAGTQLDAKADVFTVAAAQDATVDVNTVGFEPDHLLTATYGNVFNDSILLNLHFDVGVVDNTGATPPQAMYGIRSGDADLAATLSGRVTNSYGIGQMNAAGAFVWAGEFGAFDALGFSCTTRLATSGSDQVGYLALAYGGAVSHWAGMVTGPAANGAWARADPGFTPQFVMMGLTQMPALDTGYTDASAGSWGFSGFDADDEYCNSVQDEDAQATTDTQSLSNDQALDFPLDSGAAGYAGAFTSFDANGWTLNITANAGGDKWWGLAVGEEGVAPSPDVLAFMTWRTPWRSQDD